MTVDGKLCGNLPSSTLPGEEYIVTCINGGLIGSQVKIENSTAVEGGLKLAEV